MSEPNYHKINFYFQNKPGYSGLSILEISEIVMYDLHETKIWKNQNYVTWIQTPL